MNKITTILFIFLTVICLHVFPKPTQAQACPDENWCYCGEGDLTNCCEREGSGGYNCGGGTGDVPCGEWYACPTINNPAKLCKNDCGGGGGSCTPTATKVNCPANSTRGNTVVSSQCGTTCAGTGSAQEIGGACCAWFNPPKECGDWYPDNCGADGPGGLPPCQRDCTNEEPYCISYSLVTYNCIATCTSTAPSAPTLLSPSNGNPVTTTSINLNWNTSSQTWGAGCPTNNNQYRVYIGTTSSNLALVTTVNSTVGTYPFNTGTSGQTYYWRIVASNGSLTTASPTYNFTINVLLDPWWQVKDGDVTTNGDITSQVPNTLLFNTIGLGGFPGVPVYGSSFSLYPTYTSRISTNRWHANTATTMPRIFDYSYFENLVPDDLVFNDIGNLNDGTEVDGYEWFKVVGDYTLESIDFTDRKVILFVEEGNLTINGNVNLTDGSGFFGAFVDGDIAVSPTVSGAPGLEGVYLSDGVFNSGPGSTQLHIRGSVASYGGTSLERDLVSGNTTTAGELFEFAPDQMLLFPEALMFRRSKWAEVAP